MTSIAAATLGGALATRPANAQSTAALRRIEDLAVTSSDISPVHVSGQGWFETVLAKGEVDGILRIAGPDGQHWLRTDFNGELHPEWFAQHEDGPDDALMIQRACDFAAQFGPLAIRLRATRYHCRSMLVIDPTRMSLRGNGAVLDYADMPEPAQSKPIATLDDITLEAGWRTLDGALIREEGKVSVLSHYLALPDTGRYRVSFVIGALTGNSDYPAVDVSVSGAKRTRLGGITAIAPGRYEFEIDGPQPAARLGIETDASVRINSLKITAQGRRECVLIAAGEASPQYGHKWIEGIEIAGPGEGTTLHGIRFETNAEAKSSRLELRNVTVRGFQTGLVFSHRAYLIRATGLRVSCEIGLHFLGGLRDAGELISLYGSVIDGGRIAVLNNGAEFAFFGTAIDFVDQVFVGSGRLMLQACHLEVNRPKAADKPLIDLAHGNLTLDGGSFGVTGSDFESGNQCAHIFELRSRAATASMREVSVYNLRSQSGALAGGPGRLDTTLMRGRRPRHMAPIVQFGAARNLFGPLPLDLRTSSAADGPFEYFPTQVTSFKVSPAFRHIWIFGFAPADVELGLAFGIRSELPGTILATLQAFEGDTRISVGDNWPLKVTSDWQRYLNNTGDTHPASTLRGRMPTGFSEIALNLDLSGLEGTIEVADFFLCAV